ncbi:MAG: glycosyltransferase family 2 protein, partial [Bradymonadaceae bacterium]
MNDVPEDHAGTGDSASDIVASSDVLSEPEEASLDLSVVLPCLDEAETVGTCVRRALESMETHGIDGEVVIADNGSTDGDREIAEEAGARVVDIPQRGYGAALQGGIEAARGTYVVMADADDSYALEDVHRFYDKLLEGHDVVMGNRFAGGIQEGAMPFLHKHLGNPLLSWIGRIFFDSDIGDFHCGLRGFDRDKIHELDLRTTGMEFASELIVKAELHDLAITEIPT